MAEDASWCKNSESHALVCRFQANPPARCSKRRHSAPRTTLPILQQTKLRQHAVRATWHRTSYNQLLMSRFLRGKVFRMRPISINDSVNSGVCSEVLCLSPVVCSLAVFRTASRAATRSSRTRNDKSSELIILTASETKQGKGNH